MPTIESIRAIAELVTEYDTLNGILAGADDHREGCIEEIIQAFDNTVECEAIPGDDLNETKKQAARLALQYYLDGVRQMRDKIGAELNAQGIDTDAPRPVAGAAVTQEPEAAAAVDNPDAAPAQAAAE